MPVRRPFRTIETSDWESPNSFASNVCDGLPAGEYYSLLMFSLGGMMLMAVAADLLVVFLALEILSLALYVLTSIGRASDPAGPRALHSAAPRG